MRLYSERGVSKKWYTRNLKISPFLGEFLAYWDALLIIDLCCPQISFLKTRLYFKMLSTDMFCWKLLGVSFNCLKHLVSIISTEILYLVKGNSAETEVCHWYWLKCLLGWGEFKYFRCSVWCLFFFSLCVCKWVCINIYINSCIY